jgi:hypothetical protein
MSAINASLLIGAVTLFLTCTINALVFGIMLGGMRAEFRQMADRLAKIEGMFTMVPRSPNEVAKPLSVGLVFAARAVRYLGIYPYHTENATVHA